MISDMRYLLFGMTRQISVVVMKRRDKVVADQKSLNLELKLETFRKK